MTTEIWTATEVTKEAILFTVTSENGEREQWIEKSQGLPTLLALGGYPAIMGAVLSMHPAGWSFRKVGDHIYIGMDTIDQTTT